MKLALYIAPGNPITFQLGVATEVNTVVARFAQDNTIDEIVRPPIIYVPYVVSLRSFAKLMNFPA